MSKQYQVAFVLIDGSKIVILVNADTHEKARVKAVKALFPNYRVRVRLVDGMTVKEM